MTGTAGEPAGGPVRHLDPRSLRGLAHPLRLRILAALRDFGPATATQLAGRLGESSGATSYHLRQLAAHGFVAEDRDRARGRERWWAPVHDSTGIDRSLLDHPAPEVAGAMRSLLSDIAAAHTRDLETWLATMGGWPPDWRQVSETSDYLLRLTPERAGELSARLHAVIQDYRDQPAGADDQRVRIQLHLFPVADPGPRPGPEGPGTTRP